MQPGDFVIHKWDPKTAAHIMEVEDVRAGDIKVRYLNGDLIGGESSAWIAAEMFRHATLELLDDVEFVDRETVFVGAI